MEILNFSYTDAKNKQSNRKVVVLQKPNDKLCGLEVRELDDESIFHLVQDLVKLKAQYDKAMEEITAKYDLRYNYRMFFTDKMKETKVEKVL